MPLTLKNPWVILSAVLAILAILGGVYFKGYRSGKQTVQALWDAETLRQVMETDKERQGRKDKARTIDGSAWPTYNEIVEENARLQGELENERKNDASYNCKPSAVGVRNVNQRIRPPAR